MSATIEALPKSSIQQLFNIKNPAYVKNPYAFYAEVREQYPVYKTPYGVYVITRHNDILSFLGSNKLTKNYWGPIENIYGPSAKHEPGFMLISRWLTNLNPPDHTQLRRLLTTALSNKELTSLHEVAAHTANKLIDGFIADKQTDLMKTYAFKLPAMIICQLLAIPDEDFNFVFEHVNLPNVLLDPVYHSRETLDKANHSVDLLMEYFTVLCEKRRHHLGNDLVSLLLIAKQGQQVDLSDVELISNIFFLFGAGYETTMNLIANVFITLFSHPEELEKVKMNGALLPQAIEEVLRYESPVHVASPSMTIDQLKIGDFVIPKGEIVIPIIGSGNRDPRQYHEPDKFDILREPKRILSFGSGIHLCIGSHLARLEAKIATECLFKRLPGLMIKEVDCPKWRPHVGLRGPTELIAMWK